MRREDLRKALLVYCELDTLAMVRLARFLEHGSEAGANAGSILIQFNTNGPSVR